MEKQYINKEREHESLTDEFLPHLRVIRKIRAPELRRAIAQREDVTGKQTRRVAGWEIPTGVFHNTPAVQMFTCTSRRLRSYSGGEGGLTGIQQGFKFTASSSLTPKILSTGFLPSLYGLPLS